MFSTNKRVFKRNVSSGFDDGRTGISLVTEIEELVEVIIDSVDSIVDVSGRDFGVEKVDNKGDPVECPESNFSEFCTISSVSKPILSSTIEPFLTSTVDSTLSVSLNTGRSSTIFTGRTFVVVSNFLIFIVLFLPIFRIVLLELFTNCDLVFVFKALPLRGVVLGGGVWKKLMICSNIRINNCISGV